MYNVHIEVASLVYIYVGLYVGSKTIFFPVNTTTCTKLCTNDYI